MLYYYSKKVDYILNFLTSIGFTAGLLKKITYQQDLILCFTLS